MYLHDRFTSCDRLICLLNEILKAGIKRFGASKLCLNCKRSLPLIRNLKQSVKVSKYFSKHRIVKKSPEIKPIFKVGSTEFLTIYIANFNEVSERTVLRFFLRGGSGCTQANQ